MNKNLDKKIENKIKEDLSPARNLTGIHLKIVASIAIIWSLFQFRSRESRKSIGQYHYERYLGRDW